jgi:hypothetical protein
VAEILNRVVEYLGKVEGTKWVTGGGLDGFSGHDCTLFCADWAHLLTGKDPARGIRGTYHSMAQALSIVNGHGGMEKFIGTRLEADGWWKVPMLPVTGDIGVVKAPIALFGGAEQVEILPAIRCGHAWMIRTGNGYRGGMFQHLAAWRFG